MATEALERSHQNLTGFVDRHADIHAGSPAIFSDGPHR